MLVWNNCLYFFRCFLSSVQEYNWFLYVYFISCNFTKSWLITSNRFWVVFRIFCIHKYIICKGTFFFFCLVALARIPSTILNESGENRHPVWFLIFEEKLSIFIQSTSHQLWVCCMRPFFCWVIIWKFLSWKDVAFC